MTHYISVESNSVTTIDTDYWTINNSNLSYILGNVGIGVPYPRASLHIDGNMSIGYNYQPQPDNLIINGNIGIGTNNPQDRVHIIGGNMIANSILLFNDTSNSVGIYSDGIRNDNGTLRLQGMAQNGITILGNSNVGIGMSNPQATLDVSGTCIARGHVIQTVTVTDTTHGVYSIAANTMVALPTLNLVITPKTINNKILLQWMVNGEVGNDTVFVVHRNGVAIGYNTDAGTAAWSGTVAAAWDNNTASTPSNYYISWIDTPATTSATTYSLGIRGANTGATYTFNLNRTNDATGQDYRETMISNGVAWEVAT